MTNSNISHRDKEICKKEILGQLRFSFQTHFACFSAAYLSRVATWGDTMRRDATRRDARYPARGNELWKLQRHSNFHVSIVMCLSTLTRARTRGHRKAWETNVFSQSLLRKRDSTWWSSARVYVYVFTFIARSYDLRHHRDHVVDPHDNSIRSRTLMRSSWVQLN